MPTSAAIKVARGREAKIEALKTAYTDGPGDRDEQAKYDLAVEFINGLRKTSAQAYTAAELSKRGFYKLKNNGGRVPAAKKIGRPAYLNWEDIESLNKKIVDAQRSQKSIRSGGDGKDSFGQLVAYQLMMKAGNAHALPALPARATMRKYFRNSMTIMHSWYWIPFLS